MQTVSIRRVPSSRATIAAGTRPPRVMQTMAWNGPASARRQASARESRWNWSQETGKAFCAWGSDISKPFVSQCRQHLFHLLHGRSDFLRIAATDDNLVLEFSVGVARVRAHRQSRMRFRDV